jgi:hypothetical protein
MAKSRIGEWLNDEVNRTLLSGWARNGLTDKQMCENMGISKDTFYKWKRENSDFADLLKENKDYADTQVENALYKAAMEGNTTAQIFWLKNRRRDNWRDKQDVEVSGDISIVDVMRKADERRERLENESD